MDLLRINGSRLAEGINNKRIIVDAIEYPLKDAGNFRLCKNVIIFLIFVW